MNTVTLNNSTIAVTVPHHIFSQYTPRTDRILKMPSGDTRIEPRESVARGRILSEAMSIIGNTCELSLIQNESIGPADVEHTARRIMLINHLAEHARYDFNQILMRANAGLRMPFGMSEDLFIATHAANGDIPDDILALAHKTLNNWHEIEISYRTFKSTRPEWKIRILAELPMQIGLCRVDIKLLINRENIE